MITSDSSSPPIAAVVVALCRAESVAHNLVYLRDILLYLGTVYNILVLGNYESISMM